MHWTICCSFLKKKKTEKNTAPPFTWPALLTEPTDKPPYLTNSGIAFKDFKRTASGNVNFFMRTDSSHLILCQIKLFFFAKIYKRNLNGLSTTAMIPGAFSGEKREGGNWRAEVRTRAGLHFVLMSTDLRCNIRHWCKLAPRFIFSGYNLLVWKWRI